MREFVQHNPRCTGMIGDREAFVPARNATLWHLFPTRDPASPFFSSSKHDCNGSDWISDDFGDALSFKDSVNP